MGDISLVLHCIPYFIQSISCIHMECSICELGFYPPAIKHCNGKSPINGGMKKIGKSWKITDKW